MENHDCHDCRQCSENNAAKSDEAQSPKSARRRFLQGAAVAAGGLVLGIQVNARAQVEAADGPDNAPSTPDGPVMIEQQFALPSKVLAEVGAFEVIESDNGSIIVARTDATTIVACSAICTHIGCTIGYEHESQQFVCPCHGARYETTGKVVKGPAKRDLKSYQTRLVLGLSAPVE